MKMDFGYIVLFIHADTCILDNCFSKINQNIPILLFGCEQLVFEANSSYNTKQLDRLT